MGWLTGAGASFQFAQQDAPERLLSAEDDDFSSILDITRAMEESQRLLKKWERMWCVKGSKNFSFNSVNFS
jgi:hypothetical protein